jgi:hypothetical protein
MSAVSACQRTLWSNCRPDNCGQRQRVLGAEPSRRSVDRLTDPDAPDLYCENVDGGPDDQGCDPPCPVVTHLGVRRQQSNKSVERTPQDRDGVCPPGGQDDPKRRKLKIISYNAA